MTTERRLLVDLSGTSVRIIVCLSPSPNSAFSSTLGSNTNQDIPNRQRDSCHWKGGKTEIIKIIKARFAIAGASPSALPVHDEGKNMDFEMARGHEIRAVTTFYKSDGGGN